MHAIKSKVGLRGSNVGFKLTAPEDLWRVEVDEGQMNQVFNNLIINADKAMPNGGTIEARIENVTLTGAEGLPLPEGKYVKISIADSGIGIPKENLAKVFDPYFSTKQVGHGLGLATAYSIVTRHDGLITVQSVPGAGATFEIYLPAVGNKKTARSGRIIET